MIEINIQVTSTDKEVNSALTAAVTDAIELALSGLPDKPNMAYTASFNPNVKGRLNFSKNRGGFFSRKKRDS